MSTPSKIIRDSVDAVRRWEAPRVEAQGGDAAAVLGLLTAEQVAQIQDVAFREAREQGYAEGLKQGLEQAQKDLAQKAQDLQKRAQLFDQLLHTLHAPFEQLDEQIEQELFQLTVALARQIVRRELKSDPGQIVAIVREAVALLPAVTRQPHVYVHPDDGAFIRQVFSMSGEQDNWKLIDDPSLQRGDCRVVTENSRIDATLESRFAAIVAETLGGERETDGADSAK